MNALKRFFSGRDHMSHRSDRRGENRRRAKMQLELLEGRQLMTGMILTVNTTSDSSSAAGLTLREAIQVSNGTLAVSALNSSAQQQVQTVKTLSQNQITFNIPETEGTKVDSEGSDYYYEIDLSTALPAVSKSVLIDGYSNGTSQVFNGYTPIELNYKATKPQASPFAGLTISANNVTVEGLSIVGFQGGGVKITGQHDELDSDWVGLTPSQMSSGNQEFGLEFTSSSATGDTLVGSTISNNDGPGVLMTGGSSFNSLLCDVIGLGPDGTPDLKMGNTGDGVQICDGSHSNAIGESLGVAGGDGNTISNNGGNGIHITKADPWTGLSSPAYGNAVEGNYIGLDSRGSSPVGNRLNGVLVDMGVYGNTIGGPIVVSSKGAWNASAGNVISANGWSGVEVLDVTASSTTANVVEGNYIGTDKTGLQTVDSYGYSLGNAMDGIYILDSSHVTVGGSATVVNGLDNLATNVSSNNGLIGVETNGSSHIVEAGNYIGFGANALGVDIANGQYAVADTSGSTITLGGSGSGAGNYLFSFWKGDVALFGSTNFSAWDNIIVAGNSQYCVYVNKTTNAQFEGNDFFAVPCTDGSGQAYNVFYVSGPNNGFDSGTHSPNYSDSLSDWQKLFHV
jgi:hypothetical protein